MELICGGKEAEIEDQIQELNGIRDHELVQNGIIGKYLPMIRRISEKALQRATSERSSLIDNDMGHVSVSLLERSAILALCKIMCISKEICGENVPLIF